MTHILEQFDALRLEPLTPVHVGTGDTLDPLSYIIRKGENGHFLHHIDLAAWIEDQPDPLALADKFAHMNLTDIRAMIAREVDPDLYGAAVARVVTQEIVHKYERELRDSSSPNQLKLSPCMRTPISGAPFIPGSSIKGAIRTAVLDCLDREHELGLRAALKTGGKEAYDNRIKAFLGDIKANAFANLTIGDFQAGPADCLATSAVEVRERLKERGNSTPKNDCEVMASRLLGGDDNFALHGRMLLGAHNARTRDKVLTVKHPVTDKTIAWDAGELMELCNDFYVKRFRDEWDRFYTRPHLAHVAKALEPVRELCLAPPPDAMLLRVGHYSHVECMTVTDNAPKTRPTRDRKGFFPFGTTRTLADGRLPFGWVLLRFCDDAEYQEALRNVHKRLKAETERRTSRRLEIHEQAAAQERAKAERERQERAERETRERREAELAALSPEERLIVQLERGELNENQEMELYQMLDAMGEEPRQRAAKGLKECWRQKAGKWSGKLSKKQDIKVQKIKTLLGE